MLILFAAHVLSDSKCYDSITFGFKFECPDGELFVVQLKLCQSRQYSLKVFLHNELTIAEHMLPQLSCWQHQYNQLKNLLVTSSYFRCTSPRQVMPRQKQRQRDLISFGNNISLQSASFFLYFVPLLRCIL